MGCPGVKTELAGFCDDYAANTRGKATVIIAHPSVIRSLLASPADSYSHSVEPRETSLAKFRIFGIDLVENPMMKAGQILIQNGEGVGRLYKWPYMEDGIPKIIDMKDVYMIVDTMMEESHDEN